MIRPSPHLLDAARIKTADRVLDIGCGCGQTTRITADRAAEGEVLGVDISAPMLTEARLRAEREGLAGPASAGWNRIASVRNR
jgi:cyclopropane fatty-acyl-phospholipid synthase-like methyltransferase